MSTRVPVLIWAIKPDLKISRVRMVAAFFRIPLTVGARVSSELPLVWWAYADGGLYVLQSTIVFLVR